MEGTAHTAKRGTKPSAWIARLLLPALLTTCMPLVAHAEEAGRSSKSKLTVSAVVASRCEIGASTVRVDDGGSVDESSALDAVTLKCANGVQPRTSVAYEAVGSQSDAGATDSGDEGKNLVVTVMF